MTPPPITLMPTMGGEQSRVSNPIYLIPELDEHWPKCSKAESCDDSPCSMSEQAMPSTNLMEGVDEYTHSVRIGVELTATTVLLDTAVPTAKLTTSRAETLQYITTVSRLMLPFATMDPCYVFDTGSQLNIAFPERKAPGAQNKNQAETSIPLHCLVLHVGFKR